MRRADTDRMQTTRHTHQERLAAVLILALAAGCGGSGKTSGVAGAQKTQSSTLVGAGSTLVAPLVAQWQSPYSTAHGVTVAYSAIGSGGGIEQMTASTST